MARRIMVAALAAGLLAAGPLAAQDGGDLRERTEQLRLEGRRGPSLLRPGFGVGEYTGVASARHSSTDVFGVHEGARAHVEFTASAPAMGEISAACAGGESLTQLLWITFDRDPLAYNCTYSNGGRLSMAASRGGWRARLAQPQRAGEFSWNGVTYRFQTQRIGGLGFSLTGGAMGYALSRDGVDIAGLDLNGMRPSFYLPPAGSPDRDAAAVWALSLFFFADPARN